MRNTHQRPAQLWRKVKFCLLALAFLGCGQVPNEVHLIIPDGYKGSFAIQVDDPDGAELKKMNGPYIAPIPESGLLKLKGFDPFRSYLNTAAFVSGKPIWVEKKMGDKPAAGEVGLWGLGTRTCYENGKQINRYFWFVGTEAEWRATDGESQYKMGGIRKEKER